MLDAQVAADADGARGLVGELGEILELARALVGAEVTGPRGPAADACSGWRSDELRDATHHTYELYGVPFMYPDVRQGPVVAKLSLARGDRARGRAGGARRVSAGARRGHGAARRAPIWPTR